jgi:transposase
LAALIFVDGTEPLSAMDGGFSAWIGIVPGEYSTGGKQKLLGISKRENPCLRMLFILFKVLALSCNNAHHKAVGGAEDFGTREK